MKIDPSYAKALEIALAMQKRGIICARPVFRPLHRYLKKDGFAGSDAMYDTAMSIPCYPALKKKEIEDIIMAFEVLKG